MWKFGRLINRTKYAEILNFNIKHNALILQINNKTRTMFSLVYNRLEFKMAIIF